MAGTIKKTISLPPHIAREMEEIAREEGKTLSAVIQDAIKLALKARHKNDFYEIQGYWSKKAREKGIITEEDLEGYLRE